MRGSCVYNEIKRDQLQISVMLKRHEWSSECFIRKHLTGYKQQDINDAYLQFITECPQKLYSHKLF